MRIRLGMLARGSLIRRASDFVVAPVATARESYRTDRAEFRVRQTRAAELLDRSGLSRGRENRGADAPPM
jgi:hypothetical protein